MILKLFVTAAFKKSSKNDAKRVPPLHLQETLESDYTTVSFKKYRKICSNQLISKDFVINP